MSDIYIAEKLRKILRQRQQQCRDSLCHGAIKDFTDVLVLRATLRELEQLDQELTALLSQLGTEEDD